MPNEKYLAYLKSPEWRAKRVQVLARDKYRCFECGASGPLEVHHTTYKRIFNEDLDDLIALCPTCHDDEHKPKPQTIYVKAPKVKVKHNPPGSGKRKKSKPTTTPQQAKEFYRLKAQAFEQTKIDKPKVPAVYRSRRDRF